MRADGRRLPRVVFCIGGLERGGSETQLVAMLERLHGAKLDATVVTLSQPADGALLERLRRAGVAVISLRPDGGPRPWRVAVAALRMAVLLVLRRPDAVYAWLEEATLLAAPLARLTGTPLLVARRNIFGPYAQRGGAVVRAIHLAERQARVVTVNSRAVGEVTLARGVDAARVRLVPNGHVVQPELPAPLDGEVAIGYVARFRAEKGHLRLLDALARVCASAPWRVDLAGDGPLQEQIEAEARRLGVQDRVRFAGAIADPGAFWATHHIAALLSDHEGSPNALIEAALAGRPIVATAVGGVPDVVAPDGGRLVSPDDPEAIAEALSAFIDDAALRRRAGAAARAHAEEHFSMDGSVAGHWAAIQEALAR
jgi:glycosyltransferase involved in cell wall biosynthesis